MERKGRRQRKGEGEEGKERKGKERKGRRVRIRKALCFARVQDVGSKSKQGSRCIARCLVA